MSNSKKACPSIKDKESWGNSTVDCRQISLTLSSRVKINSSSHAEFVPMLSVRGFLSKMIVADDVIIPKSVTTAVGSQAEGAKNEPLAVDKTIRRGQAVAYGRERHFCLVGPIIVDRHPDCIASIVE
jgi:hypothetical protein